MRPLIFVAFLAMWTAGCQSEDAGQEPSAKPPGAKQDVQDKAAASTPAQVAAPPRSQRASAPHASAQDAERAEYVRQVRVVVGDARAVAAAITGDMAEAPRRIRAAKDSIDRLPDPPPGDGNLTQVPELIRRVKGEVYIAEAVLQLLAVAGNAPGPQGKRPLDELAEKAKELRETAKHIDALLR